MESPFRREIYGLKKASSNSLVSSTREIKKIEPDILDKIRDNIPFLKKLDHLPLGLQSTIKGGMNLSRTFNISLETVLFSKFQETDMATKSNLEGEIKVKITTEIKPSIKDKIKENMIIIYIRHQ
ncbi:hypothetical protein RF11_00569 [Thelohanellus kitauei]|uniref:Uncharacterized protein n=1 Tax=Thelohanellus kitauei TaxID=669202 RepID=A0A0C2ND24_THEKT|nr:hypothetical protein RF11_00569 [Thelohanellus kitauei]